MTSGSESDKAKDAARGTGDAIKTADQEARDNAQAISNAAKSNLDDAAKDLYKEDKEKLTDK